MAILYAHTVFSAMTLLSPPSCLCGSIQFTLVVVTHENGERYVTEFVSCLTCGVMFHRPEPRPSSIEPMTPERREFLKKTGWLK